MSSAEKQFKNEDQQMTINFSAENNFWENFSNFKENQINKIKNMFLPENVKEELIANIENKKNLEESAKINKKSIEKYLIESQEKSQDKLSQIVSGRNIEENENIRAIFASSNLVLIQNPIYIQQKRLKEEEEEKKRLEKIKRDTFWKNFIEIYPPVFSEKNKVNQNLNFFDEDLDKKLIFQSKKNVNRMSKMNNLNFTFDSEIFYKWDIRANIFKYPYE